MSLQQNLQAPLVLAVVLSLLACKDRPQPPVVNAAHAGATTETAMSTYGKDPNLPPPDEDLIPTVNAAEAIGWPENAAPKAHAGNQVQRFAADLKHPRWLYVLPNGDVLVAESNAPAKPEQDKGIKEWVMGLVKEDAGAAVPSADRITLLRDADGDGRAEQRHVFLDNLHSPFGMTLIGDSLYIANTDAVVKVPYKQGQTSISAKPSRLVDLPAGPINYHWTKGLTASPDGSKLYVAVGSNSNIAENGMDKEKGRAAIWEVDINTGEHRIYASGLRNPVGMTWVGDTLWTAVNERDELGDHLVPDYMTSVQEEGFYGWPYSYFGQHVDERVEPQKPQKVQQAIKPDYALGAHTASLGLTYTENQDRVAGMGKGMFVGQHGSWNREPRSGYKVIFVPFAGQEPAGQPRDLLTGFLNEDGQARGRPVGVVLDKQGDLLVADDVGNTIWHVSEAGRTDS
ncbi:PQQ-dependent sugar dehydrogenase [Bowmanella dokdonensis]|uniref:Sorbosone dehydrogenase family protein n=1 Tax=Bowmanella dokdonensis TaxID=751969 RepID=A0A939IPE0_9ALTE|nr:sorbosone dehydrogenase family protein [Bowmanella dokdonensis]MBN7825795.1 sorbosone dehydrogenase family protein [Bowmanella dokdonensis]